MLSVFIVWPALALAPAVAFALAYRRCRRRVVLTTSLAWLVYAIWESGMRLRLLCSGECNIRVDLLLIYPLLIILSVVSVVVLLRVRRGAR